VIIQPHAEGNTRPGSEPSSVEADVHVWRYALLVVHTKKEEDWYTRLDLDKAVKWVVVVVAGSIMG